ncbi:MAG: GNAT family N-acetyltransferase [Candidatus Kariarchaeaceae archaeon]
MGFARVITDTATFGYLGDVFIFDDHKGKGLGKWLIKTIMNYSQFEHLRSWLLYTKDAHTLYEKFGWKRLDNIERAMSIRISAEELYKT